MPPDTQAPVQQDASATGQAAATPSPEPQAPQAQQQPATTPPATQDWHNRYNGLQRVHQTTVTQLTDAQQALQQQAQHAQTLEQQLAQVQQTQADLATQQAQQAAQLQAAQQENQFWNLVNSDQFRQLAPFAEFIQRDPDSARQQEILTGMMARMGGQIQATAEQVVRNQFAGVTPASSVPVTQPTSQQPSYDEVMRHVMDDNLARTNPQEHERWMEIYRNHPGMNYDSLGTGKFVDPIPNHYQTRRQVAQQEGGARVPPQPVERDTGIVPGGPWNGS